MTHDAASDGFDLQALVAALESAAAERGTDDATANLLRQARKALLAKQHEADTERSRYRNLFDAVPDPVSIIAEDGTVLDLNKAGMQAYKRPPEEIVGRNINVLNPDLPRDHLVPVWETLNRGETYVIEVTNMRGDGTRFPVEVHSANINFDGRKSIVAVARDISSRRLAEMRYRELMETIDKGIVVNNRDLVVQYCNGAAMRIFGIREDQRVNHELSLDRWHVVDEHGREMQRNELPAQRALNSGQMVESVLLGMYHRERKHLIWVTATSVPQFAPGESRPSQVTTLFSDVTELKRDSALFDRAQSLAHIGGWEWDIGRDRMYLTDEAQRILGAARPLITLDDMLTCLREADRRRLRGALDLVTAGGKGFDLELQGTQADGHPFWIRVIGDAEPGDPGASRITGTMQDISQDKQAEETLRIQARTDPLTGLMNRDAVLTELGARLSDPERAQVAVLYIDLDRFKMVNDVLGHNAGDELLVQASDRIRGAVGTDGMIARFGGDEFLVICDAGDDPQLPEQLAHAVLGAFADSFRFGKDEFAITASIGLAVAPGDGLRPQQLIQNADIAMYDSKHRARNGWQSFTQELAQRQQDRLQIETQLRRAVDNEEFRLVYQPQVDLRNGHIIAAEALIRWQNHQLGELRPDVFISHAETTGDIVRIGSWVLREACRQVAAWRDQGLGIVRVAVNVSYRQFAGDDLADRVRAILAEFDLPGAALELEFTERVLIEDAPATLRTFADLRQLGVVLTIDDFGEGYSALNYLRRLPIHGLKLSPLFTEGVPNNRSDVAVCQAVSAIARSLGLGLVAEGVESEAQRQFLLNLGVPVGQGFLFAPGLSPDEFARRLADTPLERALHA
ncbi:PAS domain S-box-containing protein/diguanylate cyclase (GGDEF) domain-containing protein [Pseudoxanthomonas sp. CF385]|uniref:sensor domain-containing protein n=1 Tax=Pseudoxanthomonas sp. CF385 TaxID=1881042 RepID=UPI00088B32CA|nr:EAL domain-containing protein [Pseudoxanthomonas sp. CF385]SDQ59701.1 PAS domain S-box-containing protein/diguanylate cyclase (GGDEF) domain-containing protein [Pseudoxanthomonas sp. CF385]